MSSSKKTHKGMILIYSIFVVVFILVFVTAVLNQIQNGMFLTKNMIGETRAYWAAVSGLEYAESKLNENIYWPLIKAKSDKLGNYNITIQPTASEVKITGKDDKTGDSFLISFSKEISDTSTPNNPSSTIARLDCDYPSSFNNAWYMTVNPTAANNFEAKEITVSNSTKHSLFIPPGAKMYIAVQGESGNKLFRLEKIYRTEAFKSGYPAAIYANNIDIRVKGKFLVNQTGGRHPAVLCRHNFSIMSPDPVFDNIGGMPCFLQDGIIFTDSESIYIAGKEFKRSDLTISEKYRIRMEKPSNYLTLNMQVPESPRAKTISNAVINVVRMPHSLTQLSKLTGKEKSSDLAKISSSWKEPHPRDSEEIYSLLVTETESTPLVLKGFDEAITAQNLLESLNQYINNPNLPEEDKQQYRELQQSLRAKISQVQPIKPVGKVYNYARKNSGISAADMAVINDNIKISGTTIVVKGQLKSRKDVILKSYGGNASSNGVNYGVKFEKGSFVSAAEDVTIKGGVEGTGEIVGKNVTIEGPIKFNEEADGYTNIYANHDINIKIDQRDPGFTAYDINPLWITANFMLYSPPNTSGNELSDAYIKKLLDTVTLKNVTSKNDFPMANDVKMNYKNSTLRNILLKKYLYTSSSGNNSPEAAVRHIYSSLVKKKDSFSKNAVYSLFEVNPTSLISLAPASPPLAMKNSSDTVPSSSFKGVLCCGGDANLDIQSGSFSVEGVILCGDSLTETGLDNFIVRYDPSLSQVCINPAESDYRVSEILFGRF